MRALILFLTRLVRPGLALTILRAGLIAPALVLPGLAREEIPAEQRTFGASAYYGYSGDLSACDSEVVLDKIRDRFSTVERRFWNSDAEIVAIGQIRQAAFRPHGLDLIPRRYCQAMATMSDNRKLKLRYAIIEGAGITGLSEGIQYCLDGYDRNLTAMGGCNRLDR
jgi:hypothetical protein